MVVGDPSDVLRCAEPAEWNLLKDDRPNNEARIMRKEI